MSADRKMTLEEARSGLRAAEGAIEAGQPGALRVEGVTEAGLRLAEEVDRLERELERSEARARAVAVRQGRSYAGGHELISGEDAGGPRHFLGRQPVHAGAGLYLLTALGWMPGRYESSRDPEGELAGRFYFGIPGCGSRDFSLPIVSSMLFAWPREVKGGRHA